MAKKSDSRPGYSKLLDAWDPPENAGKPVGCLATTFTFSPDFFEEECLARFLNLESDSSDGPIYLVEREEKLWQLSCASVLVDQQHCRGSRSLRWDLLPSRARGLQHAKVSLLVWTDRIRIIIASANLTDDGYRRNQEVFGVLDYMPEGQAPLRCLQDTVDFLRQLAGHENEVGPSPAHTRWNAILDTSLNTVIRSNWGLAEPEALKAPVRVATLFSGPGYPNVFKSLTQVWPKGPSANLAAVVSPFFDPPMTENRPASELWKLLPARGDATVEYHLTTEPIPGEDKVYVHAPESICQPSNRSQANTEFHALSLELGRPLHAKTIWLQNDRWALYMIGSSNFTSRGTGCVENANFEANLVYVVDTHRHSQVYDQLVHSFPESERITQEVRFKPIPSEDEEAVDGQLLLPKQFVAATFDVDGHSQASITFQFDGVPLAGWRLITENNIQFFDEVAWNTLGRPATFARVWDEPRAPSGFHVSWPGSVGSAWLPVNVRSGEVLPPPDELKNIPLEVLINILSSARPLHRVLADYLAKRKSDLAEVLEGSAVINPHKRVDTTQFLLQRTRRVSWALNALRERLERPAATLDALRWRLTGPVGVKVFAEALVREAKSVDEQAFLISELALELARAKPLAHERCVPLDQHLGEIKKMILQLKELVPADGTGEQSNLREYVDTVFGVVAS